MRLARCSLHEKCPNTEFFWSVFSCIPTEYGDLLRKSPYSVQIQENADQKELRVWTIFMQWFVPKTKVEVKTDGHLIVFILVCNVKHDWTDQNNFLVCSRLKLKVLTVLFSNVNVLYIHIEIFIPKSFFSFQ